MLNCGVCSGAACEDRGPKQKNRGLFCLTRQLRSRDSVFLFTRGAWNKVYVW